MGSKSEIIFGNPIDKKMIAKGRRSQMKFRKKFGDDSKKIYHFAAESVPALASMGVQKLVLSDQPFVFPAKAVIIGNIRMGFGHYRISIAMASCAKALGYTPFWLDLASFDAMGSKMIRYQNKLYSTGSKISQKSPLFNRLVWEPMNSEGFRKLSYNSVDQANAELLVPLFRDIPKDIPYIATHVWPAQAAIHVTALNVAVGQKIGSRFKSAVDLAIGDDEGPLARNLAVFAHQIGRIIDLVKVITVWDKDIALLQLRRDRADGPDVENEIGLELADDDRR